MDRHDDYQWHDQYNQVADPSTIDIRDLLNEEWEFMTKPDFNPVPLALELMDGSSLGKDYDMFCMILRSIEGALKAVVDGSYQGFNASIGTYGGVIDSITDSQSRVKELRMDLKNSKESLRLRHADLVQLYNKSQQYKDMIEMLDEIEDLKQVPEKLETLIREKHFLAAVKLLVSASKTIAKPEMVSVGALSDLTRFLNEQLESMAEMLMEELHNHLYLKSPYCDSRWATYTTGQEALPSAERGLFDGLGKDKLGSLSSDRLKRSAGFQPKSKPGNEVRLDDEMITEDLEVNPEVDSTYYLEILVESLGLLGKFKDAIVTILQRVPLETYQLIDKTISEVNERRNAAALKTIHTRDSNFDDEDDEKYLATKNTENEILRDLFWTLFSKLECVTQGHSTVLVAGQRLLRRVEGDHVKRKEMGLTGVKMYAFAEVWTPMLTEIRCLLSDYLMDTNQGDDALDNYLGGTGHDSGSDLMRSRKSNRDKNRQQLFKFTDSIGGSSLCKVYDNEIGIFATEPLRKALPQVYAQMTEQGPSLAFSGLIQDKYAEVLANHSIAALNPDGKGSGSSAQGGGNGAGSGATGGSGGSSSSSSKKAAAATANSVPLIPGYLKAAQNGVTGWKNPALMNGSSSTTTANNQLQTSASGHQSLVRADPAHISVVIRPAVAFVERIRESVPQSREDGTVVVGAFFDHGVINVPMGRF
ncbi:MAG: Sec8 exocyst complex component-specific domain-containing protein [Linnemannia gamsii]|nr:MAG: Sec8 exocyst complex component-specific domain-containing protein [Linnemannia gamsii]